MQRLQQLTEQAIGDAIEAAYWQFDAMRKGTNEWRDTPKAERDAFKLVCWGLSKGVFPICIEMLNAPAALDAKDARIRELEAQVATFHQSKRMVNRVK